MARIETDPNYSSPTFSRATAGTDLFKKEDVQALAAAVSTHDHSTGKGAVLVAGSIPAGSITSGMIADATIDTADLKDGAVTSAKIADGTIATTDLADSAVTNAKLASDTARANLLTNGGFEIWQRGNGPFTINGAVLADRWHQNIAGTDTFSTTRNTANADAGSQACAATSFTLGTGAGASMFYQDLAIADPGWGQLAGRTVTFSARVRTSTANAVRLAINNYVAGNSYTYSSFHTGGGAYETLTVTATLTTNVTIPRFTFFFAASCTAYLDNAMLVVGSVTADYAPLHPADDLARCQRYYQTMGQGDNAFPFFSGYGAASQNAQFSMPFMQTKAVYPTVTKTGTWLTTNCSQPIGAYQTRDGVVVQLSVTAQGAFQTRPDSSDDSITIESNP